MRDEQRNKLEQMASLENRSVSNLIEVMADERWKRLAEQQGITYAKTVAEAMKLKLDMDNPADRKKLRQAVLDLVAGRKMPTQAWLKFSRSLSDKHFVVRFALLPQRAGDTSASGVARNAFRRWDCAFAIRSPNCRHVKSAIATLNRRIAACVRNT